MKEREKWQSKFAPHNFLIDPSMLEKQQTHGIGLEENVIIIKFITIEYYKRSKDC